MTADGDIPSGPPPGWHVRHVMQTGSTNADLLRAAHDGTAGDRTVLVTDHQTAGRGRLDRRWDAPARANLLASLLLTDPPDGNEVTQRVGLAIARAVDRFAGRDAPVSPTVSLKWPNDVLVGEAKLAGVLAQRSPTAGTVVGFGVNVGWAPAGAAWLCDPDGLAAETDPATLLMAILTEFDALPRDVAGSYRDRLSTLGRAVRVELPGGRTVTGRATDVAPGGALLVVDEHGATHRFDAGDVVHLRSA